MIAALPLLGDAPACAASRHTLMFGWLMNPGRGWRDALSLEPSRAPV